MSNEEPDAKPAKRRAPARSGADTRDRLVDGAIGTLRARGIAGTSARAVAAEAGVNQALIFHHFGGMDGLIAEACRRATERRVVHYREQFAGVTSLRELLAVGRLMHTAERAEGNVAVLAQVLAAGQTDPALGRVSADALQLWVVEIEVVLARVLKDSPLAPLVDAPSLSRAVSAAFVGLELYEGVDPDGGAVAVNALDQLGALVDLIEDLGPLARRAVRARVRRAAGA